MFGVAFGWGLGIGFAFYLGKYLWPENEDIWIRHNKIKRRVEEELKRKKR